MIAQGIPGSEYYGSRGGVLVDHSDVEGLEVRHVGRDAARSELSDRQREEVRLRASPRHGGEALVAAADGSHGGR